MQTGICEVVLLNAPVISSLSRAILGDVFTKVNSLILAGSAVADSLVSVFDGAAVLGTAQADAAGLWRFKTGMLADGAHSFSVIATDSLGDTSAASAAGSAGTGLALSGQGRRPPASRRPGQR